MIVWLAALSAAQAAAPIDCAAFAKQAGTPVVITSTPITPAEIGSDGPLPGFPGTIPSFAVGKLVYRGDGIAIRSNDPRFDGIELGDMAYLYHRCGYIIDGPTGWNASDPNLSTQTIRFSHGNMFPAQDVASSRGTAPTLPGYSLGRNGLVYAGRGMYLIGLMHHETDKETLVVAFLGLPGPSRVEILARLPIRFDGLQLLPFIHGPGYDIGLQGRDPDGTLHYANFTLTGPEVDRLGVEFAAPEN